jgi:hypothetical protein
MSEPSAGTHLCWGYSKCQHNRYFGRSLQNGEGELDSGLLQSYSSWEVSVSPDTALHELDSVSLPTYLPACLPARPLALEYLYFWRMVSSGMLHHMALVITDVSEEFSASFIGVTRIGELGTTLAVTSNGHLFLRSMRRLLVTASVVPTSPILVTLMKEALSSSETSVLTRATWRNISEDTILHSHRRDSLKSYVYTFVIFLLEVSLFLVHCDLLPVLMLFRYDFGANKLIGSPPGYRRRSPFVPFAIRNDIASRIWFTTLITSPDRWELFCDCRV